MVSIESPFPVEELIALMQSTDDIGIVLRADFMLEAALTAKCKQLFPEIETVYKDRIGAKLCCNLMQLVNIPSDIWRPCNMVSKIRNEFAHGKSKRLTMKHVTRISEQMSENYKGFSQPDNIYATLDNESKVPLPEENKSQKLFLGLVGLQYGHILSLSGNFRTDVSFADNRASSNWSSMKV